MHEFADGLFNYHRLVGDLLDLDALRHRRHEGVLGLFDFLAELENVGAVGRHHAERQCRRAALPDLEIRRIDKAVAHGGDVAEAEGATAALDRRFRDRLEPVERAGDTERHAL